MNILVDADEVSDFKYKKIICDVIDMALKIENISAEPQVSVLIVHDEKMRQLNKKFRGIDKTTDVLSFPIIDFNTCDKNILTQENILLGDIVICIDKVFSQATEYMHSVEREIGFLTAHGILHLLGYDHISPEDEKIMFAKQDLILEKVGLER